MQMHTLRPQRVPQTRDDTGGLGGGGDLALPLPETRV